MYSETIESKGPIEAHLVPSDQMQELRKLLEELGVDFEDTDYSINRDFSISFYALKKIRENEPLTPLGIDRVVKPLGYRYAEVFTSENTKKIIFLGDDGMDPHVRFSTFRQFAAKGQFLFNNQFIKIEDDE